MSDHIYSAIRAAAEAIAPQAIAWRRDIHAHPEMSNMEFRTSRLVAGHLRQLKLDEVHEGLAGGTGVIGVLRGGHSGPTVGLRADMDAQAVLETTGLPFASKAVCQWGGETVPVMHCCGHDVHTAIGMAAAAVLAGMREELCGTVLFVFQPAEEGPSPGWRGPHGAQAMMEEEAFRRCWPDAMFALHIDPNQPAGTAGELSFAVGQTCMAISAFSIELSGVGGHNAKPWMGVDTLLPGAQILLQVAPEQAGVLVGGLQVQLVPAGLHGKAQLLHRLAVVRIGPDREAVPLHRDGPLRAHPAGVGVVQRQGPVGAQQDHVAHKNTPPSPPRWAGPGPPGATISISIGGDNIYFLFIPIPITLSLPFPITAPLVVRKGATIRAILSRGKEMMHCDGKNRRSEERVYPLL